MLVDYVVVAPEQMQTTQTVYEPAISGEIVRPLQSFSLMEQGPARIIAQRVTDALSKGDAVNIGFGISANVPRILLEQERHGDVTFTAGARSSGRCSPAGLPVWLRIQRRSVYAVTSAVHLFSGRRL